MEYRIIFSDIDGTLLNTSHQIPPDTKQEILKLEEQGIPFILVSARMPAGVLTIQEQLGNHAPIVCYNGGLVRGLKGETLYSCQVSLALAEEVKADVSRRFPELCWNTYGGNRWIVDDDRSLWVRKEEQITALKAQMGDVRESFWDMGGIHKFLLMGQPELISETEAYLHEKYPMLMASRSKAEYLEVLNPSASKSDGVRFLCDYYGIPAEQAMAFGDGHNDIDMFRAVGNSYAMGNADEEVKQAARHVTRTNDEEGLLAALRENRWFTGK
ncbi:MAG: Cof-type HAD-IIB family hydrolase [Lachnospiraceae bacterium]|nr:Cof-type HAD-IIB family hydrolase [Lachnospiraceae bacterium]